MKDSLEIHLHDNIKSMPPSDHRYCTVKTNLSNNTFRDHEIDVLWSDFVNGLPTSNRWEYPTTGEIIDRLNSVCNLRKARTTICAGSDAALKYINFCFSSSGQSIRPSECYPGLVHYSDCFFSQVHCIDWIGIRTEKILSDYRSVIQKKSPALVFLENPNGLDGRILTIEEVFEIGRICQEHGSIMVIDEAYGVFAKLDHTSLLDRLSNLVIVRTLSKSHGAAPVRIALIFSNKSIIESLNQMRLTKDISELAIRYLDFTLKHTKRYETLIQEKIATREKYKNLFTKTFPSWEIKNSQGNFLTCAISEESIFHVISEMDKAGYSVRNHQCNGKGLIRITIGLDEEMESLFHFLRTLA